MSLSQKKVAILVEQNYQELEVWYPYYRLKEEDVDVFFVGPQANKEYPSKLGYPAITHRAALDVKANDLHGIIIPGGWAPDYLRRHQEIVSLTRDMMILNKPVASICHGGWLLCSSKVIKNRKVTSFSAIRDDMENAGAIWIDAEVVQDQNIITSRKPDDLPAFMKTFLSLLQKTTV